MAFNSLMHDRNIYKERPDFSKIALEHPEFRKYTLPDAKGKVRVDFNNPEALRALTKILLKKDFNLNVEIPKGFLIPTVPQRLNYILWIEDLLSVLSNISKIPHGIDIGCGPCAIFSILGAKKNGWKFTSTETSNQALEWALTNIKYNELNSQIKVVKVSPDYTLKEVLSSSEEIYDFCLCNPPFFENLEEIRHKNDRVKETLPMIAKHEEIIAEGGEVAFVKKIIDESYEFKHRIRLYTSMFGKKKSFIEIYKILQNLEDISLTKSQFCQGNTVRWGIAWTFSKNICFEKIEKPKPKKPKKAKPPLVYHIPREIKDSVYNVQELSKSIWKVLEDLEIQIKIIRSYEHYIESNITTDKNTWSHQRRRRRELKRKRDITDAESPEKRIKLQPDLAEDANYVKIDSKPTFESEKELSVVSSTEATASDYEKQNDCVMTPEKTTHSESVSKKRKLSEESENVCKKVRTNEDAAEDNINVKGEDTLKNFENSKDLLQSKSLLSTNNIAEVKQELDLVSENALKTDNTNLEQLKNICEEDNSLKKIKAESSDCFEPKSLLFCTLKIRKAKDFVLIEMHCLPEANHESMYQIFQYLKNKIK